jgi:lipid-A-disaccharide synthase-like uncharacterized protein
VNNRKLLKYLRTASLIWLLLLGGFWFGFALLSGAERYGGGIDGVIQNSPNALPWLLLLIVAAMSFRWPLAGAICTALFGLHSLIQYDAFKNPVVLFAVSLPLLIISALLFLSRFRQSQDQSKA